MLTAAAWVPLNLIFLWLGGWEFLLWVAILAIAATSEMLNLLIKAGRPPISWLGPLIVFAFLVGAWAMPPGTLFYLVGPVLMISMALMLATHRQTVIFERWGLTTSACLYTGLLVSYMVLLRDAPNGLRWMGAALLGTWVFDTAGYLVGRQWGCHPLMPAVSPGKTWEGTIGGLVLTAAAALAAAPLLKLSYPLAFGLGLLIATLAQVGDLVESLIKRQVNVKDSGSFLPGHGGVLDRIDGLIFSTVGVFYFALLLGQ
ncbi:MAG: phosphatidate cytidylyltransferase [Chloroflexota bacterium]